MVERNSFNDQADELRRQVEKKGLSEEVDVLSLPSRKEYHNEKKKKKVKFRVKFPLIRFILFLFFVIVVLALTSPMWLARLGG